MMPEECQLGQLLAFLEVEPDMGCGCHHVKHHDEPRENQCAISNEAMVVPIVMDEIL